LSIKGDNVRIQLDTKNAIIVIEESTNLGELVEILKRLLPNGKWKDFRLEVKKEINLVLEPVIVEYLYNPKIWGTFPWITYGTNSSNLDGKVTNYCLNSGIFDIEA